ncbi:hypothetical protein [Mahella australiensis]|uniref:Beta-agarase n=1 Tax=Mahella australiensis (strain DSM 15567 / CIP 107919 / 50-1 BON) TaxID=697281 RepID=F3ZWS9_MAHA5|nr:hypothetical protein [Mahella australiensis]AEE96522.1 Beta-agarase [Mahella australiensis 50-1 BON]
MVISDLTHFLAERCEVNISENGNSIVLDFDKEGGDLICEKDILEQWWRNEGYLILDVLNHEQWVMGVVIKFWEINSTKPDLSVTMGVLPGIKARLSLPSNALNSQHMFLPRTPGKLKTVVAGQGVDPSKICKLSISSMECFTRQRLEIFDMHVAKEEPDYPLPDTVLVDKLGQLITREWYGKTHGEDELKVYLLNESEKSISAQGRCALDEYGGWQNKRFKASGFFRTEYDGRRWWLVDPEGNAFYSLGMDCVWPGENAYINGIRKFFEWLPDEKGAFKEAWTISTSNSDENYFNFTIADFIKTFGNVWWGQWARITRRRLLEWGINTIGNWSSPDFIKCARMPYVWPLADFPDTEYKVFRDFPDVFSEEYEKNAIKFARQLEPFKEDPYMIGYFLRNEPQWAFIQDLNLARILLEDDNPSASKDALISFLAKRYDGDIQKLSKEWNIDLLSFDQLKNSLDTTALSPKALADLDDFSEVMIERYVAVPSKEVKKIDPDHLNLGMRYGYISQDKLLAGHQNFDVFSINCYKMSPASDVDYVGKIIDMPVLVGEFHFGALDRGLLATGLRAVTDQQQRGVAFKYYVETGAANKYCVGTHYFQLNDQPVLGRYDGENFQIGAVDVCCKPYNEFTEGIKSASFDLYKVMAGEKSAYNIYPKEIERIGF